MQERKLVAQSQYRSCVIVKALHANNKKKLISSSTGDRCDWCSNTQILFKLTRYDNTGPVGLRPSHITSIRIVTLFSVM